MYNVIIEISYSILSCSTGPQLMVKRKCSHLYTLQYCKKVSFHHFIRLLILQIDLILTLEENIPECIHQRVIVKRPIIVQPRKVEDIITHCKCFLNASCLMCSAIFCNINHVLYWLYKYEQPDKKEPSKLYYDIPGLNKQIKLHKVH